LAADVERLPQPFRAEQRIRQLAMPVDPRTPGLAVLDAAGVLELGEERAASIHPVEAQAGAVFHHRGRPETAVAGDAAVRLQVVPGLLLERLGRLDRPLA